MTKRTLLLAGFVLLCLAGSALAAKYGDLSEFRYIRRTSSYGPSDFLESADITVAELRAKQVFKVDTGAGAVDLDFANDAALDAADIGSQWRFFIGIGGTNALTVTAGASGVTTVKTIAVGGAACEDVGDFIDVIAYSTTQASVVTYCAD